MNRRLTAAMLITATVLSGTGITALGVVFNYPDILKEPASQILAAFRESPTAVAGWFLVLAIGAALMIPIAAGVGRLSRHRLMRLAVPVGMLAGLVQATGLLRWPLLVPGYALDAASGDPATVAAAEQSFQTAHRILGNLIGETLGYLFTAGWTILVVVALGRTIAGRWFSTLGVTAAILIVTGVLSPLDLPFVDLANLVGYLLWAGWLVAFAVQILRGRPTRATTTVAARPLAVATANERSS